MVLAPGAPEVENRTMVSGMAPASTAQPERFFDGGTDEEPYDVTRRPQIVLERLDHAVGDRADADRFMMLRRLGYDDAGLGLILVPAHLGRVPTDLASVPAVFTWLVPKTGRHLPAALIHDGLVADASAEPDYVSVAGHRIDRAEADRVFRDAMRDCGTGLVRRWLVWSAVTLGTFADGSPWGSAQRWRYRIVGFGSLLLVALLGTIATLDLLDVVFWLPWMGARPWWAELIGGAAGAVVIPLLLGLAWGRFAVAGVVLGVSIALLLHVSVAVLAISGLYQVLERVVGRWPRLVLMVAAVGVVAAGGVLVVAVVGG